jgi:hypothetical protein
MTQRGDKTEQRGQREGQKSVEVSRERLEKGETKEREQRKGKKANSEGWEG